MTEQRPRTRGDCKDGLRPCPWVGCRHHTYADERKAKSPVRSLLLQKDSNRKTIAPDELHKLKYTCSLDAADEGPRTLQEVGQIMGLTRERVRQIESSAFQHLKELTENWNLSKSEIIDIISNRSD